MRSLLFAALLLAPGVAQSASTVVKVHKDTSAERGFGTVAAQACDSTIYTGWLRVNDLRAVALDIAFDEDSGTDVTSVTMTCQSSQSGTTANGAGYDIHVLASTSASGTSTSVIHTFSNATAGDESWSWTVTRLPGAYLNCALVCNGTVTSSDELALELRGLSP